MRKKKLTFELDKEKSLKESSEILKLFIYGDIKMKENKKVILEQGNENDFKRIIIEQGTEDTSQDNTPQWNYMKTTLKEQIARKGILFGRSFISSLVISFWIAIALVSGLLLYLKGGF